MNNYKYCFAYIIGIWAVSGFKSLDVAPAGGGYFYLQILYRELY